MTDTPGYPGNGTPYQGVYYGPAPIVQAMVHGISTIYGRAMDWRSRGYRAPDKSSPDVSYRGYEPALQRFAGGLVSSSAANVRGGLNQLLPGTTGLPGDPSQPYVVPDDPRSMLPGSPL